MKLLLCFLLSSCTTFYYPNGQKAAVVGSNLQGLSIQSKSLTVHADVIDNAIVHKEIGNTVVKTSGLVGPLIFPH